MLKLTIGFSLLSACFSNKMLHHSAPFFPLRCLSPQIVTKMLNTAHHTEIFKKNYVNASDKKYIKLIV